MTAIESALPEGFLSLSDGIVYRKCSNYFDQGVCNWLVPRGEQGRLCQACKLNRVVPDLSQPKNKALWATMETAKRRLLYSLNRLRLPTSGSSSPRLRFDIKQDTPSEPAMTGHSDGLITLNLSEADPVAREETRLELAERYRTPLGHFRHEIGHYYWDLFVRGSELLQPFREVFGDERADYVEALRRHYDEPRGDWEGEFVSSYASSHPWEDWAETWAHYLHIVDSLDTAHAHRLSTKSGYDARDAEEFSEVIEEWGRLAVALNGLNRSMGLPDAYPFEVSTAIRNKLMVVHRVVVESGA